MSFKKRLLKKSIKTVLANNAPVEHDVVHCPDELATKLESVMHRHAALEAVLRQSQPLRAALQRVQAWQKRRISSTYQRLLSHEAFGAATRFVLEEAYAGPEHDALIVEIERVIPHVVRLFPSPLVKTASDILSLNTLTLALDVEVAKWLIEQVEGFDEHGLDGALYEHAYCAVGNFPERYEQLALMDSLGASVEHYLGSHWVYAAFKVAKLPAKALGLNALVRFMQCGFEAIHKLPVPATDLVNLLVVTERGYVDRLARGERSVFSPNCQTADSHSQSLLQRLVPQSECDPVAI